MFLEVERDEIISASKKFKVHNTCTKPFLYNPDSCIQVSTNFFRFLDTEPVKIFSQLFLLQAKKPIIKFVFSTAKAVYRSVTYDKHEQKRNTVSATHAVLHSYLEGLLAQIKIFETLTRRKV